MHIGCLCGSAERDPVARPTDLLGKYLVWPNAAPLSGGTNAPAGGATVDTNSTLGLSLRVVSPVGLIPGGAATGATRMAADATPWSVTFLKYLDGGITQARLSSAVLTGAMSGCYTFRYKLAGCEYVAHVGTGAAPDVTRRVKQDWKRFASNLDDITGVDSFYDADVIQQIVAATGVAFNRVLTFHYYDASSVYKILLVLERASVGPNLWKVHRVEKLTPLPWKLIKLGPKFILV